MQVLADANTAAEKAICVRGIHDWVQVRRHDAGPEVDLVSE